MRDMNKLKKSFRAYMANKPEETREDIDRRFEEYKERMHKNADHYQPDSLVSKEWRDNFMKEL